MKYIVTGRKGSGKSSFISEVQNELRTYSFIECSLDHFLKTVYQEGDKVVLVDTPFLLCLRRNDLRFNEKAVNIEDPLLSYVTELPNCTIIKNDGDLDTLKVHAKKFARLL